MFFHFWDEVLSQKFIFAARIEENYPAYKGRVLMLQWFFVDDEVIVGEFFSKII